MPVRKTARTKRKKLCQHKQPLENLPYHEGGAPAHTRQNQEHQV